MSAIDLASWSTWTLKSSDFNRLYEMVAIETNRDKARQLWTAMNDLLVNRFVRVALVEKKAVDAKARSLRGPDQRSFDGGFAWNLADWTRV